MFIVIPMTSEIEPSLIRVWGKDNEKSPNFVEELGEFLEEKKALSYRNFLASLAIATISSSLTLLLSWRVWIRIRLLSLLKCKK